VELRDHLQDILEATVRDMNSSQSDLQQADKSKGDGEAEASSVALDGASVQHGVSRVESGLEQMAVVAEYRALRATVIRHWRNSNPNPDLHDIHDLTGFNESIDQSLTEAIHSYVERVTHSRQMFLAMLGHDLRNPL